MSLSHRAGPALGATGDGRGSTPVSPPALRDRASRWADPRLWLGVLLVLGSVLVGAKLLAAADDTVAVWRVEHPAAAGSPITSSDVRLTRVHFSDAADAQRYVGAAMPLPEDVRLTRDIGAGELLAVSAITTAHAALQQQLPLGVAGGGMPSGLSPGDHVDVWAVPPADSRRPRPVNVLQDVTVTAVSGAGIGGVTADRQILVGLSEGTDVGRALAALNGASVVLIQNGV